MKRTREFKNNKGITLIALVITIIVMLILVAVTIAMAVDGGLFSKATYAGLKSNEAVKAEQELGNEKIKIKEGSLIYEYETINAYFTNTPSNVYADGGNEVEIPGGETGTTTSCEKCGGDFSRFDFYCNQCDAYFETSEISALYRNSCQCGNVYFDTMDYMDPSGWCEICETNTEYGQYWEVHAICGVQDYEGLTENDTCDECGAEHIVN